MAVPLEDLNTLSQYLTDISGDTLVSNYEQMTIRGGRKMTFALQRPDAKELVIRFTPDFFNPDARPATPNATLRQRANSDLTEAFRQGNAVLEVVNKDNKRTAYVSKKTHKTLLHKIFHRKKPGKESKYTEVKVVSEEHFEKMVQMLVAHKVSPDELTPQITKEVLVESAKDLPPSPSQQITPQQLAIKGQAKHTIRAADSVKSKKRKEVEEGELEKQTEKEIEQERNQLHAKHSKKEHQERVDKTVEAQERRKAEDTR